MKNLKVFLSTALVSLIIAAPQKAIAADDSMKPQEDRLSYASYTPGNPVDGFLKDSPFLNHQAATELYRSSVQSLRQEILGLQQNAASSSIDSESNIVQKEIDHLASMLSLQQEALGKYGLDHKATQEKITQEIKDLSDSKAKNQQNMLDKPAMKGLYEAQIKDAQARLEVCQKYLGSLEKSASVLQGELDATKAYLKTLGQKASSAGHAKQTLAQKVESLVKFYETHVQGLCGPGVFSHNLPKEAFESLGINAAQLNFVHTERLFQLFARSLELPYAVVQTGGDIEASYLKQLETVKANLANRIQEDMFCLQLCLSMAQNKSFDFDFASQNAIVEKLLANPKALEASINKNNDLEKFKDIFVSYGGYGKPSPFLETILNKSSYGLLGLYIGSLEFSPVMSWNDPGKVSGHAQLKSAKTPGEFSTIALGTVFNILGRRVNIQVLDKIQEKMESAGKSSSSFSAHADDFYI